MPRLLVLAATLLLPVYVHASRIAILFDSQGYVDEACVTPMVPLRSYVVAVLGGDATAGGIRAAEFRLVGYDTGWTNTAVPNPAADFVLGSPLASGCQMAFPTCQAVPATVLLYTIDTVVSAAIPDVLLQVVVHDSPSPLFTCPLLILCDAPVYTRIWVAGGDAVLRQCPVRVDEMTWTAVRGMYH